MLFILYLIFNYNSQFFNYISFYSIIQFNVVPVKPLINYNDLSNTLILRVELKNKAGVYGIINTKSSKQYIGSSLNLYSRLMVNIKGRDSNLRLQRSIHKDGLKNFKIVIYYFHKDPAVFITDIETTVISAFPFSSLYNFKKEGNSMLGYKHTKQAIEKMKLRLANKNNHPMFGKKHSLSVLNLISKPGKLNPMFGKKHNEKTKKLMSIKKSIRPLGLYDDNNNLIEKYSNQVELAIKFNVHKTTISRFIKSGKLFKSKFFIKEIKS